MDIDQVVCFIPARYHSTRLPGKPLVELAGTPMIMRVYHAAEEAQTVGRIIVLTDEDRIYDVVAERGGKVMKTPVECRNGTERIAFALQSLPCEIAVNLQGDEPLMKGEYIDQAVKPLLRKPGIQISTLACPIESEEELMNPSAVKVVCDNEGLALYFSRSPIPSPENTPFEKHLNGEKPIWLKHIGLYAYHAGVVRAVMKSEPTMLEQAEKLEQLRMLELGYRIHVEIIPEGLIGVDTPEDLEVVNRIFEERSGTSH